MEQRGFGEMKIFSITTLRDAYGEAAAAALVLERRAKAPASGRVGIPGGTSATHFICPSSRPGPTY